MCSSVSIDTAFLQVSFGRRAVCVGCSNIEDTRLGQCFHQQLNTSRIDATKSLVVENINVRLVVRAFRVTNLLQNTAVKKIEDFDSSLDGAVAFLCRRFAFAPLFFFLLLRYSLIYLFFSSFGQVLQSLMRCLRPFSR